MSTTTFKTSDKHRGAAKSLDLPTRLLLGPGPSNISQRVNLQLAQPMVGYMDPSYWKVMDETMELMRYLFQTDNQFTIPISGAGSAAMETCLSNLIEPGDVIVVGVSGYFSERICEMAQRYGAEVRRVEAKWGTWLSHDDISAAIQKHKPTLVAVVHGETSTGVRQGIEGLGKICHDAGALLMVDTVASLGGVPMLVDEWGVDACYTGGQKCLSGPPGISPLTFSPRAMERINKRKKPVANWYLDANMLASYWCPPPNTPRKYHHTTPANLLYCLRESLVVLAEEGIDNVWARHTASAEALYVALEEIGMHVLVCDDKGKDPSCAAGGRLHSLTSVRIPDGIDAPTIQKFLMENYGIEVAGGLGQLAGKIIRVGLMGYNSKVSNVKLLQTALKQCLDKHLKK